MSYTETHTAAATGIPARQATGLMTYFRGRMTQYKVYRRTLNELDRLNDRDLADLGLVRSMIQSVALDAAYGQR